MILTIPHSHYYRVKAYCFHISELRPQASWRAMSLCRNLLEPEIMMEYMRGLGLGFGFRVRV